jgi:uncharacterized protein YgiM (DUF1202 family)
MRKPFLLVLVLGIGGMAFSQTQGQTMYVAVRSAALKSSTGFFAKTLSILSLGEAVTVIRDAGKWMEIRAGASRTGWAAAASLSAKRVTGSGYSAAVGEIALAGKGFSPEVEMEYRKNGLDYSTVDSMENLNIPDEELLQFIDDGHLSKGE